MPMQRALSGFLAAFLLGMLFGATAPAIAQENDSLKPRSGELRFKVVHVHLSGNCAGYFYVSRDAVRYKAVVPENSASHSFEIRREEITALQPWVLMGQPQNLAFAVGETVDDGAAGAEIIDDEPGDGTGNDRSALHHGPDGAHQFVGGAGFGQVSTSAGFEGLNQEARALIGN